MKANGGALVGEEKNDEFSLVKMVLKRCYIYIIGGWLWMSGMYFDIGEIYRLLQGTIYTV